MSARLRSRWTWELERAPLEVLEEKNVNVGNPSLVYGSVRSPMRRRLLQSCGRRQLRRPECSPAAAAGHCPSRGQGCLCVPAVKLDLTKNEAGLANLNGRPAGHRVLLNHAGLASLDGANPAERITSAALRR
jgi:hypothetical protein